MICFVERLSQTPHTQSKRLGITLYSHVCPSTAQWKLNNILWITLWLCCLFSTLYLFLSHSDRCRLWIAHEAITATDNCIICHSDVNMSPDAINVNCHPFRKNIPPIISTQFSNRIKPTSNEIVPSSLAFEFNWWWNCYIWHIELSAIGAGDLFFICFESIKFLPTAWRGLW